MAKLNSGTRIYGNVTVDTFVTATGNVTGSNILTAGLVSATGTITSATNITGGNLLTAGLVSATGTITTAGNLSLTGNIVDIGELWINTTANGNINLNPNGTGQVNIPVGILSVTGNIQGGNLRTAGLISATGNITGGNVISGGVRAYKWTTQANTAPSDAVPGDAWYDSYASKYYLYVNDGTGNQWVDQSFPTSFYDLSVTGNIQGGNVLTNGLVSATGNITGSYFIGNGSQLTGLPAGYSNADVATFLASFGSNTISTTGTITAGNISPGNVTTTGQVSATGNITGGNIVSGGGVGGNITGANVISGNTFNATTVSATGNITGNYILGNGALLTGVSTTSSNINNGTSNVTVVSSGGNVTVGIGGTGNVAVFSTSGLDVTGRISATGNITGGNIVSGGGVGGNITGANVISGNTFNAVTVSASGNIATGNLNITGNIVDTGPISIITTSNGNISLAPNGTGNVNITGNVMPTANATSNIGSAALSFNTIFAQATSAQYADLAEMYVADADYTPGTVLDFGGSEEVTATTTSHSVRIAGIVSTNPSYLMNSTLSCTNAVKVALVGRVPCQVVGTIAKGDRLVASSTPGVATRLDMAQYQPGCIVCKALETYDSETVGTIEVAVGRT